VSHTNKIFKIFWTTLIIFQSNIVPWAMSIDA